MENCKFITQLLEHAIGRKVFIRMCLPFKYLPQFKENHLNNEDDSIEGIIRDIKYDGDYIMMTLQTEKNGYMEFLDLYQIYDINYLDDKIYLI